MARHPDEDFLQRATKFFRLQDVGTGGQAPGRAARPAPGQFEDRRAPDFSVPPSPAEAARNKNANTLAARDSAVAQRRFDTGRAPAGSPLSPQSMAARRTLAGPPPTGLAPAAGATSPRDLRRKRRPSGIRGR